MWDEKGTFPLAVDAIMLVARELMRQEVEKEAGLLDNDTADANKDEGKGKKTGKSSSSSDKKVIPEMPVNIPEEAEYSEVSDILMHRLRKSWRLLFENQSASASLENSSTKDEKKNVLGGESETKILKLLFGEDEDGLKKQKSFKLTKTEVRGHLKKFLNIGRVREDLQNLLYKYQKKTEEVAQRLWEQIFEALTEQKVVASRGSLAGTQSGWGSKKLTADIGAFAGLTDDITPYNVLRNFFVEMAGISNEFLWGGGQKDGGEKASAEEGSKSGLGSPGSPGPGSSGPASPGPASPGLSSADSGSNGGSKSSSDTSPNPKNLLTAYAALCNNSSNGNSADVSENVKHMQFWLRSGH